MTFGDINDKESKISELKENDRMYHLLEHVGTNQRDVSNKSEKRIK